MDQGKEGTTEKQNNIWTVVIEMPETTDENET